MHAAGCTDCAGASARKAGAVKVNTIVTPNKLMGYWLTD